jgi:DNA-binding transcriptional ArsR family regulator
MPNEEVFKVIASDTKRKIIKELSKGSRTPSDLSKILNKNKSTIVEHLDKLKNAGLVEKIEKPGKKWVFYMLTEQGESIVSSRTNKIVIILATTFLSLVGSIFSLFNYLKPIYFNKSLMESTETLPTLKGTGSLIVQNPLYLYLSLILFGITIIGTSAILLMRKRKIVEV